MWSSLTCRRGLTAGGEPRTPQTARSESSWPGERWEAFPQVSSGEWVPAKCTELYTHHYIVDFRSSRASKELHHALNHKHGPCRKDFFPSGGQVPVPPGQEIPLSQTISHAEGNEHRGSWRGVSAGAALLLDSPATMHGSFHCINTKSPRCGNATNCPNTGWGPGTGADLPRPSATTHGSAAPPDAKYSGLSECPCSTRRGDFRQGRGDFTYHDGCRPNWTLANQGNPTCSALTYGGGLQCCADGMSLLDEDQPIPPLVSEFRYKIRVYYTEYAPLHGPAYDNSMYLFWETEEWQTESRLSGAM